MWELKGKVHRPGYTGTLVNMHRWLGRLFIGLLVLMTYFMVRKISGYQEELSLRALIHAGLVLGLLALVLVKAWVARRLPGLTSQLFWLGTIILAMSVTLVGLTAGHYLLHRSDLRYVTVEKRSALPLDVELGRRLMFNKCGKCHSFERILRSTKDRGGWEETINRMAGYDAPNISPFDIRQITYALLSMQKDQGPAIGDTVKPEEPSKEDVGKSIIENRCSRCHTLERIFAADKTFEQWRQTIDRMLGYAGDPPLLSDSEKEDVLIFLERNR
jgi:cytochrome c2